MKGLLFTGHVTAIHPLSSLHRTRAAQPEVNQSRESIKRLRYTIMGETFLV